MPRRKVRPPMEDAVASSPLFRLSPEVRTMIYSLVLVDSDSHHALFIPTDYFKRRRNEPAFRCDTCQQGFDLLRHFKTHQSVYSNGEPCKPPMHKLPRFSTTLLRSCRLVNTEAAPLLYRANVFYFNNPHTLQAFRWKAAMYSKLSAWVEEITVELSTVLDAQGGKSNTDLWQNFLSGSGPGKKIWRLAGDFPHLKRLTIVLSNNCSLYPPPRLRDLCNSFGKNLTGLDWVHIVGLNSSDVISSLEPMVCTTWNAGSEDDHNDRLHPELKDVQKHITEYECASGWKNAQKDIILDPDQRRNLLMEQNARLLRIAKDQAPHKPEDVALQQELGDLRLDVLNRKLQSAMRPQPPPPALPINTPVEYVSPMQQDYQMQLQMQLLLLEQQNRARLRMARAEQERGQSFEELQCLRDRLVDQQDRIRALEIWVHHSGAGRSIAELTWEIGKAKTLMQQLQSRIDN
ncbi:MAG: hypothetical protein Q9169_001751 [Polycauliona sp. 2 TL-2023]